MKCTHSPKDHPFSHPLLHGGLRKILVLAAILVTVAIYTPKTYAQAVYGSIFGTVTDTSGAVIPNAAIKVTDVTKNVSVTTQANGSGDYQVQHLIPDTYRVEVTAEGFNQS